MIVSTNTKRPQLVAFVAGPAASGKTTLVRGLSHLGVTYEEKPGENPFLINLAKGEPFDAFASQTWFLRQMAFFLESLDAPVAIVDQHPLGIGSCYPQLLYENGLITPADLKVLLTTSQGLLTGLRSRGYLLATIHLSADTKTLKSRAARRGQVGLDLAWFDRIREIFSEAEFARPVFPLDSTHVTASGASDVVCQWLQALWS